MAEESTVMTELGLSLIKNLLSVGDVVMIPGALPVSEGSVVSIVEMSLMERPPTIPLPEESMSRWNVCLQPR